jgi:hypothetical protein
MIDRRGSIFCKVYDMLIHRPCPLRMTVHWTDGFSTGLAVRNDRATLYDAPLQRYGIHKVSEYDHVSRLGLRRLEQAKTGVFVEKPAKN